MKSHVHKDLQCSYVNLSCLNGPGEILTLMDTQAEDDFPPDPTLIIDLHF